MSPPRRRPLCSLRRSTTSLCLRSTASAQLRTRAAPRPPSPPSSSPPSSLVQYWQEILNSQGHCIA
uniref:Uncharacterized protein n=1 Tax=Arundo donax TaxID=35708 RepID=A0A0A9D1P3_ARUDO